MEITSLTIRAGAINSDDIQLHNVDATKAVQDVAKPFLKGIPALQQHTLANGSNYEECILYWWVIFS